MTEFVWRDAPATAELTQVRALLDAVAAVDGRPSLPEDGGVPREFRNALLLATEAGQPVGLVSLDTGGDSFGRLVAELAVAPEHRRRGIGTELATRLAERAGLDRAAEPGDRLRVWAHGNQPAAAALADRLGFVPVRQMLRLRMDITGELAAPTFPAGVTLRPFVVGADEAAMVEVNRLAFAWHPEQGSFSVADLEASEKESWFDPAGFLLAVDAAGQLLGFHWTKVHELADGPIGEVYVMGVHPNAVGSGLGTSLTLAGLRYLNERRGMRRVMLYVESDNHAALAVYRKLGFNTWDSDVQYAR